MKKLLIIAVAMAAVAANAAAFNWKTSTTGKIYEAGTTTLLGSATAYLFDAGTVSQAAVLTAFNDGKALSTLGYVDTTSVASGVINKSFDVPGAYSAGDTFAGYFALVVDDSIYIGPSVSVETPATGTKAMNFNAKASSQAAALDISGGYSGAGWYTASVPEPTSGLLMLLGMAGLALRRRRA